MSTNKIQGKMFFRDAAQDGIHDSIKTQLKENGQKMVIAMSIMAVPERMSTDEMIYIISGEDASFSDPMIQIHQMSREPAGDFTRGEGPGGILRQPIWQI